MSSRVRSEVGSECLFGLCAAIVVLLVLPLAAATAQQWPSQRGGLLLRGDVNLDGNVDAGDVLEVTRVLRGEVVLNDFATQAADLAPWTPAGPAPDGVIGPNDLMVLQRYVQGDFAPPAPTLTLVSGDANPAIVDGTAAAGSFVNFYVNGKKRGSIQLAPGVSTFASQSVPLDWLANGNVNEIWATATDPMGGEGPRSVSVEASFMATVDKSNPPTSIPSDTTVVWTSQGNQQIYQLAGPLTIGSNATLIMNRDTRVSIPSGGISIQSGGKLIVYEESRIRFVDNGALPSTRRIFLAHGAELVAVGQPGYADIRFEMQDGGEWSGIEARGATVRLSHVELVDAISPILVRRDNGIDGRLEFINSLIQRCCTAGGQGRAIHVIESEAVIAFSSLIATSAPAPLALGQIGIFLDQTLRGPDPNQGWTEIAFTSIQKFGQGIVVGVGSAADITHGTIRQNLRGITFDPKPSTCYPNGVCLTANYDPFARIRYSAFTENGPRDAQTGQQTSTEHLYFTHSFENDRYTRSSNGGGAWPDPAGPPVIVADHNWWDTEVLSEIAGGIRGDYDAQEIQATSVETDFNAIRPKVLLSPYLGALGNEVAACLLGGFVHASDSIPAGTYCYSKEAFRVSAGETFTIGESASVEIRQEDELNRTNRILVDETASFVVAGTSSDPVQIFSGIPGDPGQRWEGVYSMGPGATITIDNAEIYDVYQALDLSAGGLLTLRDSYLQEYGWSGSNIGFIHLGTAPSTGSIIERNILVGNNGTAGIKLDGVSARIAGNDISGFHKGIHLIGPVSPEIVDGNSIHDNGFAGIYLEGVTPTLADFPSPTIHYNTFYGDQYNLYFHTYPSASTLADAIQMQWNWFPDETTINGPDGTLSLSSDQIADTIHYHDPGIRMAVNLSEYLADAWVSGADPAVNPGYVAPGGVFLVGGLVGFDIRVHDPSGPVDPARDNYFEPRAGETVHVKFDVLEPGDYIVAIYEEDQMHYNNPVFSQQINMVAAGPIDVEWDGKPSGGGPILPQEIYTVLVWKGTTFGDTDNILYDRPPPTLETLNANVGLSRDDTHAGFDALTGDYWSGQITVTGSNKRVGIRVGEVSSPGSALYFPIKTPLYANPKPAANVVNGAHALVWDGRVDFANKLSVDFPTGGVGDALTVVTTVWPVRPENVFLLDQPPIVTGTGSTPPRIGVRADPYIVARSYEQVTRFAFDIDQSCDVEAKVYPAGDLDFVNEWSEPLTRLRIEQAGSEVTGTLVAGSYEAVWDWTGKDAGGQPVEYRDWSWNGSTSWSWANRGSPGYTLPPDTAVDGAYLVRIEATNPNTSLTGSFNGLLQVER